MPPANSRRRSEKQAPVVLPASSRAGASWIPSAQIDAFSGDPNFMTSLARGLAVIQVFSTHRHQLTIAHVSSKTGQPVLEHLSRLLHESCSIAALDGVDIVYVARANATRIMSIDLGVGSRLPAYCTSMGACYWPISRRKSLSRI